MVHNFVVLPVSVHTTNSGRVVVVNFLCLTGCWELGRLKRQISTRALKKE